MGDIIAGAFEFYHAYFLQVTVTICFQIRDCALNNVLLSDNNLIKTENPNTMPTIPLSQRSHLATIKFLNE